MLVFILWIVSNLVLGTSNFGLSKFLFKIGITIHSCLLIFIPCNLFDICLYNFLVHIFTATVDYILVIYMYVLQATQFAERERVWSRCSWQVVARAECCLGHAIRFMIFVDYTHCCGVTCTCYVAMTTIGYLCTHGRTHPEGHMSVASWDH